MFDCHVVLRSFEAAARTLSLKSALAGEHRARNATLHRKERVEVYGLASP
jgi:hypothetical protein